MARKRLGELLVAAGLIDELQLQSALGEQRKWGRPLGRVLVEMGLVSEDAMVEMLSRQLNIPAVQLAGRAIAPDTLRLLDLEFCTRNACLPFEYHERGRFLDVAMADPTNPQTFDQIRVRTRCNVRPYLAGAVAIDAAVRLAFGGVIPETPRKWASVPGEETFDLDTPRASVPGVTRKRPPQSTEAMQLNVAVKATPLVAHEPKGTAPVATPPPTPPPAPATAAHDSAEIAQLRREVVELRALLERDERVLRKVLGLLIEKGICSRDEVMARLASE